MSIRFGLRTGCDTHTTYSDTWFGRYGFLKSGYSAELILDRTDR
jgi:hypothetical protein